MIVGFVSALRFPPPHSATQRVLVPQQLKCSTRPRELNHVPQTSVLRLHRLAGGLRIIRCKVELRRRHPEELFRVAPFRLNS